MLQKISSLAFLAIIMLVAPLQAADSLSKWLCSGEIRLNGDSRYHAFFLDDLVYRHAATDLSDLRITDQDGEFVPYLIQSGFAMEKVTEKSHQSVLQKKHLRKDNNLYFDFAVILPDHNIDPVGTILRFKLPKGEFLKKVDVYGSYDGKRWYYLARDQLYVVQNLVKNEIHLRQPEKYGFYRIVVLDNPEQLQIKELDLIEQNYIADWSDYEKETELEYEVKHEAELTNITLMNPNRLRIKRILIDTGGNFKRSYRLTGELDDITLKTGEIFNFRLNDNAITKTEIDLADSPYSYSALNLKIVNHDDRPLKINKITIKYYCDKVIFENTGSRFYRLYFGNPEAAKPRYDLEHFQSYLEKETQDLVKVVNYKVKSSARTSEENNPTNRLKFNIIIGIVAVILIIFVVKKLNTAIN